MKKTEKYSVLAIACFQLILFSSFTCFSQNSKSYYKVQLVQGPTEVVQPITQRFEKSHPGILCRTTFYAPNFRVTIGKCGSKRAAKKLKRKFKDEYPSLKIIECHTRSR